MAGYNKHFMIWFTNRLGLFGFKFYYVELHTVFLDGVAGVEGAMNKKCSINKDELRISQSPWNVIQAWR